MNPKLVLFYLNNARNVEMLNIIVMEIVQINSQLHLKHLKQLKGCENPYGLTRNHWILILIKITITDLMLGNRLFSKVWMDF